MTTVRTRGLVRDDGRYARPPFAALKARKKLGATPTGSASVGRFVPTIVDQNRVPSCVVCGVLMAAATTLAAKGKPLNFLPSIRAAYALGLAEDRARRFPFTEAADLPPLQMSGTMILTGAKVIETWGVLPRGPLVKVDGELVECDCSPTNATQEPDLLEVEQGASRLLIGAHEISPGKYLETDVQLSLDAGNCVAIGGFVDTQHFERYGQSSSPLDVQDMSDPDGGGHCTYLTGYSYDAASGLWIYDGVNSWGRSWGRFGRFQCTSRFLRQMWEAYSLDVDLVAR